jgi:hypothetical protein
MLDLLGGPFDLNPDPFAVAHLIAIVFDALDFVSACSGFIAAHGGLVYWGDNRS